MLVFPSSVGLHDEHFTLQLPSDMSVTWNKKMRKTAGYCISGQERAGGKRYTRIELSEKVCDSAGNGMGTAWFVILYIMIFLFGVIVQLLPDTTGQG